LTRTFSARARGPFTARRRVAAIVAGLVATACAIVGLSTSADAHTARAASMISQSRCARNRAAGTITYISPFGYDASAGIIDIFMAEKLGYFKDLCLKVVVNTAATNGQELVSSGRAQATGIGSAADAILTKASGANITAIATYGDTDPHAIITNASVTSLKGLEGKTIGYYTNVSAVAAAMFAKAGADISKMHLVALTSYDPTVVTRGQVDGLIGYKSNQGVQLTLAHQKFHEFLPSQFGVKGTYNIMQINTTFLQQHRAAVADFMRADLKALDYCITNQTACVSYLSSLANAAHLGAVFPHAEQLQVWKVESRYITSDTIGGHGVQTAAEWKPEWNEVKKYGSLIGLTASDKVAPLSQTMDTTLVPTLYNGTKLIWPGS